MTLAWMAWTWQTALFFAAIAALLISLIILQRFRPSRARRGILGLTTTRGDRVFIALLGAAFIHLAWLGLSDWDLRGASLLALAWAAAVFRWV